MLPFAIWQGLIPDNDRIVVITRGIVLPARQA
jgi:hypothetical protein